jgi:hypothetical protein
MVRAHSGLKKGKVEPRFSGFSQQGFVSQTRELVGRREISFGFDKTAAE